MIFGLDTLGLARFSDAAIKALPVGVPLSAFAVTFGDAEAAVRKVCRLRKPSQLKVQMLWSDNHQFGDSDIPQLRKIARVYSKVAADFPKVKFYLSPFCEHNISQPDKYLDIVAAEAPNCKVLNTPWRGGLSRKYLNEVHGDHSVPNRKNYWYSHDGTSSVDADVEADKRKFKRAEIFWLWHPAFNGRLNSNDPTPRPERKAWPTPDLIKSLYYLRHPKGKAALPGNVLWKSHADRHNTPPESRAYKPVVLAPTNASELQLFDGKRRIATLQRAPTPFPDGRNRYYCSQFGYRLALKADGKTLGTVNPAFREGSYRD